MLVVNVGPKPPFQPTLGHARSVISKSRLTPSQALIGPLDRRPLSFNGAPKADIRGPFEASTSLDAIAVLLLNLGSRDMRRHDLGDEIVTAFAATSRFATRRANLMTEDHSNHLSSSAAAADSSQSIRALWKE